jgi:hypothetical protein
MEDEMAGSSGRPRRNRTGVIVFVGYFLWFIIAISACFGIYYLDSLQRGLSLTPEFPTSTATPEARIKPGDISNADKIFEEDFVKTTNDWSAYQGSTLFSEQNDTLVLRSVTTGRFGAVVCIECAHLDQPYYFQADLATDAATTISYGILFKSGSYSHEPFYVYQIDAQGQDYFLYTFEGVDWTLHTSGTTNLIKAYPNSNTLGIYVSGDYLEMYINGDRVDTYQESGASFQNGTFGFYINDSDTHLIVRKVIIYSVK